VDDRVHTHKRRGSAVGHASGLVTVLCALHGIRCRWGRQRGEHHRRLQRAGQRLRGPRALWPRGDVLPTG